MREIKFRAWDTVTKKFFWPWPEGFSLFGEVTCFDAMGQQLSEQGRDSILGLNDLEIEQFTGLHDKYSREIYEGDIVRFIDGENGEVVNREVYFDDELLEFGLKQSFNLFHAQFGSELEWVGTIHETPELLK